MCDWLNCSRNTQKASKAHVAYWSDALSAERIHLGVEQGRHTPHSLVITHTWPTQIGRIIQAAQQLQVTPQVSRCKCGVRIPGLTESSVERQELPWR